MIINQRPDPDWVIINQRPDPDWVESYDSALKTTGILIMRAYHFIDKENGLENIQKKRLKIATLNELNDPFELFGVESSEPAIRSTFRAMRDILSRDSGLLCFSKYWHNPVQWSHYADKHRGLCLGFDVPNVHLEEINYSRKRIEVDIEKLKNYQKLPRSEAKKYLFTKYHHWKYEGEVRCFVSLGELDEEKQLYFMSFSDELALKEIIVGAMSDVTRKELSERLKGQESHVEVFKTRLAFKTFRVVKQRKGELWV